MIAAITAAVTAAAKAVASFFGWKKTKDVRDAGKAIAQRDQLKKENEALREQLDKAVRRRPGDARRRLRDGEF